MKKLLSILLGLLISVSIYSQGQLKVFQDWQSNAGSQNFLFKNRTKTDASNNIYVVGATMNGAGNYDILVAKYNPQGTQLWITQYNGTGNANDVGTGVVIDASGNVYITGTTCTSALPTSADLIVIKYNSSGVQQWLQTYNGTGSNYDAGASIFQMTGTNVGIYVTGSSYNASGNTDFITLKYSTAGVQQWVSRYNHTSSLNDAAVGIGVNATGVTIIGAVETATTTYSCATVKYNAITGAQTGVTISTGGTSTITEVNDMVIDASNNIYITGTGIVAGQGNNYFTIKLNNLLVLQWQQTYNGASNLNDISKGIQVDASGNVFVTGYSTITGQGRNMVTIKYNSAGTQQWAQTYNNPLNTDDEAYGIALDNTGNAYVTGYNTSLIDQKDFYTIKYNTSGTSLWEIKTDGNKHLNDEATNIVIDNAGAIIVAGQSETATGVFEYLTVKYVEKNIITPTDYNGEAPANNYSYYENKGQLVNTSFGAVSSIRYYAHNTTPSLYFKNNSFSMVFAHVDTITSTQDTLHRIDAVFNNVNANAKTYPLEETPNYLNYYLDYCPDGITEVHGNKRLVTPDLYTNIDLVYYSNQNGFKYYFVIKPGGNPASIQMEYTGASSFNLNGTTNALTINSSVGSMKFDRPTVYQINTSNVIIPITGWTADWVPNGASNKYKFNIGAYDNTKPLIIQVDEGNSTSSVSAIGNLDWATFYGAITFERFYDVAYGAGAAYTTGVSYGTNFPLTTGAFQSSSASIGDWDAVVVRFATLSSHWATYYGGASSDEGNGIDVDAGHGVCYVAGTTLSSNFPIDANGIANSGNSDIFAFALSPSGLRKFGTTFGGTGAEAGYGITLDPFLKIYVVGSGWNATTPATIQSGASNFTTGNGIILKLNGEYDIVTGAPTVWGSVMWATPFGGTATSTRIKGIVVDGGYKNLFITGATTSGLNTLNATTAGSSFGGGSSDAFVAKFDATNTLVWSSYFGGNNKDEGNGITLNSQRDISIVGTTLSSTGFPLLNPGGFAKYQGTYGGGAIGSLGGDMFVAAFDNAGIQKWGTYLGGPSVEHGTGICVDNRDDIIITGYVDICCGGTFPFPSPNATGAYNVTTINGGLDGVIASFTKNYWYTWATYFGGNFEEIPFAPVTNGAVGTKLFVAGWTTSQGPAFAGITPFPIYADPLYYNQTKVNGTDVSSWGTGNSDGFLARFDLSPIIIANTDDLSPNPFNINAYPNPAQNSFMLTVDNVDNEDINVYIYNTLGQEIERKTFKDSNRFFSEIFDVSNYSGGIYFIKVNIKNADTTFKLIKN